MRKIKRIKNLLHTAMIFISVYSVSILFMPLASDLSSKTHRISTIILGLIFWVSVGIAYSSMFMANKKRKELGYEKHSKSRLGIFSFFSNVLATVVDFLLFVSVVLFVVLLFVPNNRLMYVALFMLVWSINFHCILNGKTYAVSKIDLNRGEGNDEKNKLVC